MSHLTQASSEKSFRERLTWSLDGEIESVHGLRVELDDFNTISNQNEGRISQVLFQVHFNSNHACCDVTSNHFQTVSLDAQFDDTFEKIINLKFRESFS